VLLPDSRVLVLGDKEPTVDLFVPATSRGPDTWKAAPDSISARAYHTATLLDPVSGQVLVTGGESSRTATERFDPKTDTWTPAEPMGVGRSHHTATLLQDKQVLVTGGFGSDGKAIDSSELYDVGNNKWLATGKLGLGRGMHAATLLPDGRVLVTGGVTHIDPKVATPLRTAEIYDLKTQAWEPVPDMHIPRYQHTATLMQDGRVLVVGGQPVPPPPPKDKPAPADPLDFTIGTTEIYDPAKNTWTLAGNMAQPRRKHTATLLPTCHVLVTGGGHEHTGFLDGVELFDVHSGTWSTQSSLNRARNYHAAVLLNDGRVLVVGGSNEGARGTYELYYPPRYRK
jgi:hypothetical protein